MSENLDNFTAKLDNAETGALGNVRRIDAALKVVDEPVWSHLNSLGVEAPLYAFRWVTILLASEFILPDVLRLWDSLFADPQRFSFLYDVSVAMIVSLRDVLLANDFGVCMQTLQNYPGDMNMCELLSLAVDVRDGKIHYGKKVPSKNFFSMPAATEVNGPGEPGVTRSGGSIVGGDAGGAGGSGGGSSGGGHVSTSWVGGSGTSLAAVQAAEAASAVAESSRALAAAAAARLSQLGSMKKFWG